MTAPDDLALIDRWRAGDADAGRLLVERYFEAIYRFFVTKCEAEADELTQATFLACVRAKDQFRKDASFRTYLYAIARNELYHRIRRFQRHDAKLDFDVSSIAELVTTPGTKLARHQDQQRLVEALRRLPVAQQTLLELHYWDDMGIAELAEVFEAEQPAIRTRLSRARKALRELMLAEPVPPKHLETLESMDVWVRGARPPK